MYGNDDLYRVIVQSHLSRSWSTMLPAIGFVTAFDAQDMPITELTLRVAGQAELMGLLADLHGNGLLLMLLQRLDACTRPLPASRGVAGAGNK